MVALRRDIHHWPELAGKERRTAALLAANLRDAGLSVSTSVGGHGVVAVLEGSAPGPTVAYRADIDAVAADEAAGGEFASRVPGVAHLCGHDLHAAVGVGIAQVLRPLRHRFAGRVVFVFQPAEETLDGARAIIEAGVLEREKPREIYAVHCAPLPLGTIAVMPGVGQPGLDRGYIDVSGPNALFDAAQLAATITSWSTVEYPRTYTQLTQLLADLQEPDGPLARFVVAGSTLARGNDGAVRVRFWLRAWPDNRYLPLRDDVRRLAGSVGGTRVEFHVEPFPAMVCSPELSHAAADRMRPRAWLTEVRVLRAAFPFRGDDFALFLRRVPGAMFYLGVANPDAGISGMPHAPDFAADERAIGIGVRTLADLLLTRLETLHR